MATFLYVVDLDETVYNNGLEKLAKDSCHVPPKDWQDVFYAIRAELKAAGHRFELAIVTSKPGKIVDDIMVEAAKTFAPFLPDLTQDAPAYFHAFEYLRIKGDSFESPTFVRTQTDMRHPHARLPEFETTTLNGKIDMTAARFHRVCDGGSKKRSYDMLLAGIGRFADDDNEKFMFVLDDNLDQQKAAHSLSELATIITPKVLHKGSPIGFEAFQRYSKKYPVPADYVESANVKERHLLTTKLLARVQERTTFHVRELKKRSLATAAAATAAPPPPMEYQLSAAPPPAKAARAPMYKRFVSALSAKRAPRTVASSPSPSTAHYKKRPPVCV